MLLRRWARGMLVAVIVSVVVAGAVSIAVAPLAALIPSAALTAELGGVRIVIGI